MAFVIIENDFKSAIGNGQSAMEELCRPTKI